MPELIADLQGCIRIPSVSREDDSGYPYGQSVQDCLEYVLKCAENLGFSTANLDNQVGWCEYGTGEEMVAESLSPSLTNHHRSAACTSTRNRRCR